MPAPLRAGLVTIRSLRYLAAGLRCIRKRKIEVPLLDAAAIGVSVLRRDFNTAGSVMSLNIKKVWLKRDGQEILVKADQIRKGDVVTVHMGNVIPFDGEVSGGEGMVKPGLPHRRGHACAQGAGAVRLCGDRGRGGRAGRPGQGGFSAPPDLKRSWP